MHRVVSTTRRLIVTLLVVWATAAVLLAVRPLDPGPTALAIADWPLWFSVPVVVLGWLILVASWSVALCLPLIIPLVLVVVALSVGTYLDRTRKSRTPQKEEHDK